MKGCIVGLFKLVGGIIGAIIGLMFAISFLSNEKSVSPARQLEIRCEEASKTQPPGAEQRAFYDACIASGSSAIRAQERINREASKPSGNPVNALGSESNPSPIAPVLPPDTVPQVSPTPATINPPATPDVPPTTKEAIPLQPTDAAPSATPPEGTQEKAAPANVQGKQPE